jgi:hypothetical protein
MTTDIELLIDVPPHQTKAEYILDLEKETFDLIAKITCLLSEHELWEDNGTYSFSDGDRWSRFKPEDEQEYLDYKPEEVEQHG